MSEITSTALVAAPLPLQPREAAVGPAIPVPWRDPHNVPAEDLKAYIQKLEQACLANPGSADLRTCLGIAHAVNYDVYRSMDALEEAIAIAPAHFWAQLKYAELHYRLRALPEAEREATRAVELAENAWQLTLARKQLQEIRKLNRDSTRNIPWSKPLTTPTLVLSAMFLAVAVAMMWK